MQKTCEFISHEIWSDEATVKRNGNKNGKQTKRYVSERTYGRK